MDRVPVVRPRKPELPVLIEPEPKPEPVPAADLFDRWEKKVLCTFGQLERHLPGKSSLLNLRSAFAAVRKQQFNG